MYSLQQTTLNCTQTRLCNLLCLYKGFMHISISKFGYLPNLNSCLDLKNHCSLSCMLKVSLWVSTRLQHNGLKLLFTTWNFTICKATVVLQLHVQSYPSLHQGCKYIRGQKGDKNTERRPILAILANHIICDELQPTPHLGKPACMNKSGGAWLTHWGLETKIPGVAKQCFTHLSSTHSDVATGSKS